MKTEEKRLQKLEGRIPKESPMETEADYVDRVKKSIKVLDSLFSPGMVVEHEPIDWQRVLSVRRRIYEARERAGKALSMQELIRLVEESERETRSISDAEEAESEENP